MAGASRSLVAKEGLNNMQMEGIGVLQHVVMGFYGNGMVGKNFWCCVSWLYEVPI